MMKNSNGFSRSCRCRKATRTSRANTAAMAAIGPTDSDTGFNAGRRSTFMHTSGAQSDAFHTRQLQLMVGRHQHRTTFRGTLL